MIFLPNCGSIHGEYILVYKFELLLLFLVCVSQLRFFGLNMKLLVVL